MSKQTSPFSVLNSINIGHKLITAVGIAVTIGLLSLVIFYTEAHEENLKVNNERTMRNVTQSVIESLQTVMLAGYADVAQIFADRLKEIPGVVDFRILRIDGNEAFRDNATINDVNRRRGQEDFTPRDEEAVIPVLAATHADFRAAVERRAITTFYETDSEGRRFLTFLAPIPNEDKCHKCHGQAKPVRGVLKLTTALAPVEEDVARSWRQAVGILAVAIALIMGVTAYLVRRSVVSPIVSMSHAMAEVSGGQLGRSVPVHRRDELGVMARSFNQMTDELRQSMDGFTSEQNKLTTIIQSADEGMVVTDPAGRVVLVNPAAEAILGKAAGTIIAEGIDNVLADPVRMREWLALPGGVSAQIVPFGDKVLSVTAATIVTGDGQVMGSTALFRDITEARRLEEQLRERSQTDGLTGLGNRRFLDMALAREVVRAVDQKAPLSIMMFDIDHFKRFNDTFGHDQGDRVLKAVAEAVRATVRTVDIPCRYGGEEFLVILRSTGLDGAAVIAERLREAVEAMVVDGQKVTISIGVAAWQSAGAEDAAGFVAVADQALYAAKGGGRNRVMLAQPASVDAPSGE